MLDDPRILQAEKTGACSNGTWTGLGGVFVPIKNPLPSGNSGKGKKKNLYIPIISRKGEIDNE